MDLKEYLHKEERSLAWLARKLGITRPYLSDMLRGRRLFQERFLREITRITQGKVSPVDIAKYIEKMEDDKLKI